MNYFPNYELFDDIDKANENFIRKVIVKGHYSQ